MMEFGTRNLKFCSRLRAFIRYRSIHYVQGQSSEQYAREYFYFIDHQGMLFLDDSRMKNFTSCFKEKKFLEFFFRRLRSNETGKNEAEFPFVSPCGREMNFVRCDDLPFVFTHVAHLQEPGQGKPRPFLLHNHAGDLLKVAFEPQHLCMPPGTGRVYHPAPERVGGVGLVRSLLAIEFSKHFVFADGGGDKSPPTHFNWEGTRYELSHALLPTIQRVSSWDGTEE
ncbi:unnamed protein product [Ixodes hexagonus]